MYAICLNFLFTRALICHSIRPCRQARLKAVRLSFFFFFFFCFNCYYCSREQVSFCTSFLFAAELQNSFERATRFFGPLLEPFGPGTAPWNQNDVERAACVVDKFTSLMKRLHVLYDVCLPPGCANLEALLWHYYATKIATISTSCPHIYQLLVGFDLDFIRFPFQFQLLRDFYVRILQSKYPMYSEDFFLTVFYILFLALVVSSAE